jgi:hypothetical protein
MCALFNSRESAQNSINERQRIDARALTLGTLDAYVRVAQVEIRETPGEEDEESDSHPRGIGPVPPWQVRR